MNSYLTRCIFCLLATLCFCRMQLPQAAFAEPLGPTVSADRTTDATDRTRERQRSNVEQQISESRQPFFFHRPALVASEQEVTQGIRHLLQLNDYNTHVVLCGTSILGFAAGMIGSFTLLRKRALMGDALSHATLPGIAIAFIAATSFGYDGKSLSILLPGAAISGLLGTISILGIRRYTRLQEDAALGIVLSVFFGGGVALLGIVQQMNTGHAAGLEAFIYGKTASMLAGDAWLIAYGGLSCAAVSLILFKELELLCFDEGYAGARGFPVTVLDTVLMGLVVIVTIIGLQAVGLILIIALLVIPAAAARFWSDQMSKMVWLAALIGAGSALIGTALSAWLPGLPSGAMIVLASGGGFGFSLICGPNRGILIRTFRRRRMNARVGHQHLLRAMYELVELGDEHQTSPTASPTSVKESDLLSTHSWTPRRLTRCLRRAQRAGLIERNQAGDLFLTDAGTAEAARVVRQHRLWELFLITHADIAPSHVDREADAIEHVLDREMVAELETLLDRPSDHEVPASPHPVVPIERSEH